MLQHLHESLQKQGGRPILCALDRTPQELMQRNGLLDQPGQHNCLDTLPAAFVSAAPVPADHDNSQNGVWHEQPELPKSGQNQVEYG